MYPPVEDVDRETPEVMEYHGYKIPKGATIGVRHVLLHLISFLALLAVNNNDYVNLQVNCYPMRNA